MSGISAVIFGFEGAITSSQTTNNNQCSQGKLNQDEIFVNKE